MDTTMKLTKQGIRDLNSYGPRPKPVAPDVAVTAETSEMPPVDVAAPARIEAPIAGAAVDASPDVGSS